MAKIEYAVLTQTLGGWEDCWTVWGMYRVVAVVDGTLRQDL